MFFFVFSVLLYWFQECAKWTKKKRRNMSDNILVVLMHFQNFIRKTSWLHRTIQNVQQQQNHLTKHVTLFACEIRWRLCKFRWTWIKTSRNTEETAKEVKKRKEKSKFNANDETHCVSCAKCDLKLEYRLKIDKKRVFYYSWPTEKFTSNEKR